MLGNLGAPVSENRELLTQPFTLTFSPLVVVGDCDGSSVSLAGPGVRR